MFILNKSSSSGKGNKESQKKLFIEIATIVGFVAALKSLSFLFDREWTYISQSYITSLLSPHCIHINNTLIKYSSIKHIIHLISVC